MRTRWSSYLATALAFVAPACGRTTEAEAPARYVVVAVDSSVSTGPRIDDVRDDAGALISAGALAGAREGTTFEVVVFGGGPGDTLSSTAVDRCTRSARWCADPTRAQQVADERLAQLDRLREGTGRIGGSDPFGYLYRRIAGLAARPAGERIRLVVWTDLASRSDTLDAPATDLSSATARAAAIAELAARGLDFAALRLPASVEVEIRLVPTDVTAASTIRGEHLAAFARELLAPTGAHVTVSWLTRYAAS